MAATVGAATVRELQQVVEEYHDVFVLAEDEMGCTDVVKHKIDTGDHPLIKVSTMYSLHATCQDR